MRRVFIAAVLSLLAVGSAFAEIPLVMGYQGRVTDDSGNPVADGSYIVMLRVYDAETGGTELWNSNNQWVQVSAGVFSILLGESPQPALNLAFDQDYWLLVTFDGEDQTPRRRLASVGYAYMASGLVPGTEVSGSIAGGAMKVINTEPTGWSCGVWGETSSPGGDGVFGRATATAGSAWGTGGISHSTGGGGVYGIADAVTGRNWGGWFSSASDSGIGVYGEATATSGETYGVYGVSSCFAGRGVYGGAIGYGVYGEASLYGVYGVSHSTVIGYGVRGEASASMGDTYGVRGQSASTQGTGVYGRASATTGGTYGLYGVSSSAGGTGVYGQSNAYGVYGVSYGAGGTGVHGYAPSGTGYTYGVRGESASTWGKGVHGEASATTGGTYGGSFENCSTSGGGVRALANATAGTTYGVHATSFSTSGTGVYGSGDAYGVYGKGDSMYGTGVYGEGWATAVHGRAYTHGMLGEATRQSGASWGGEFRSSSPSGTGVSGWATATSGAPVGVYGLNSSTAGGFAVYSSGDFAASGSKSCVVRTSQGPTLLYCQESPECWFEDFGEGQLADGKAHVVLDPLFLETVRIDDANPVKVFVQPDDPDCKGIAVVRGTAGFDVIELSGGTSSGTFAYRVVAKRKGFETKRLDFCEAAKTDPYLYAELREKQLRQLEEERARMKEERARMEAERARMEEEEEDRRMEQERARAEQEHRRMESEHALRE
jgi:hypothetical protein